MAPILERTLALIKPDAVANGNASEIKQLIELRGFTIIEARHLQLSHGQAEAFYAEHYGKAFFERLVEFMISGPIVAMALSRDNAIAEWRAMMGKTNVFEARKSDPKCLRALYGTDGTRNATHGSDSPFSAQRELSFFFPHLAPEVTPEFDLADYLQRVLVTGLTHLAKTKPGTDARSTVLELAKWLLANNPNKAKVMAPGAPELAALAAAPDDDIDAQIEAAERISAARKARFAAELGRKSSEVSAYNNEATVAAAKKRLVRVQSQTSLQAAMSELDDELHARQLAADAFKRIEKRDWLPEYRPISIVPPTLSKDTIIERVTRVSPASILRDVPVGRKTKIVCTLGPSCWSEEGMATLLDAGMNVARFNFSHGSHAAHQEVLDRLRKVAAQKKSPVAFLLDTKGPEIRTAMLKGGKDIYLQAGQSIIVYAAGDEYTTWEGYQNDKETKIGLSYPKLCQSVKPGNVILIADGAISIEVEAILSDKELRGRCLNASKLGQRKNCNLPGVFVDLPVLGPNDVRDVQDFAAANDMDFIAASFVQSAADVRYIRQILAAAGKPNIRIISKIENQAGLRNIDEIVAETDGIMVARGDLAMEVPAEKICLAQKMIIEKCNCAGKVVITATQMLESMIENPLPTRAEMTDVANAVIDGTHAVMLSGETANGKHPETVVRTMASIVENAELAVDASYQFDHIRNAIAARGEMSSQDATLAGAVREAVSFTLDEDGDGVIDATEGCVAVLLTDSGAAAESVSKYHPPCPVIVVSSNPGVLRKCSLWYSLYPLLVDDLSDSKAAVAAALEYAKQRRLASDGKQVIVITGYDSPSADSNAQMTVETLGDGKPVRRTAKSVGSAYTSPFASNATTCIQMLRISPALIIDKIFNFRSTKIIATIGPSSWAADKMDALLDAGISMARFNLSIPNADYREVIARFRDVAAQRRERHAGMYTSHPAVMATIKGPEIRTTALRGGAPVTLAVGDVVTFVGTSDASFEGYSAGGQTVIGISYAGLATTLRKGDAIMLEEGTLELRVTSVGDDSVVAEALTGGTVRPNRVVDLPDRKVDLPFLSSRDMNDLVFCCENHVDFVTLPFVTTHKDIVAARRVLDENKGSRIKIIAQIDNAKAISNYDTILAAADGVMVSRANLGMNIPAEKVCLAQKWMTTKANLAGKPVIVAAQMLETMVANPRPTRAEMTDVANATYDGADAILLRNETSQGLFVERAVKTAAAILKDAEVGTDYYTRFNFVRNFTPKPTANLEAMCSSAVKAAVDMNAILMCIVTDTSAPIRALAKYRPQQAIVVATTKVHVAQQCNLNYSTIPLLLPDSGMPLDVVKDRVVEFAKAQGLAQFVTGDLQSDQLVMVCSKTDKPFITNGNLTSLQLMTMVVGDEAAALQKPSGYRGEDTIAYRSTKVGLDLVCEPIDSPRKTKIICTLGPKCWSNEGIAQLITNGMNVARFNFSHGAHSDHQAVLNRVREVAAAQGSYVALMLDTKGPEIRTAMLRQHEALSLEAGQEVTIVAVGPDYVSWEGFKDAETGETKIGLSYPHLCQDVKVGGRILIGDGTIVVEVVRILNDTELVGRCLNSKKLGERKNCNLPGVKVRLPVLMDKDIDDVQNFACRNDMDFIAASFVQTADDVRFIRKVLDEAGGHRIKIISKIESAHGLKNFDDILAESDGIMVARGDLAMEIPSWKVPLAQKMMITKANIAGKFIVTATQMLESMIENPLPTRAEMTDVANAVWDGTDAVMLSGETANGAFPFVAVSTMAAIASNAEVGINYYQNYDFVRDFTDKPMSTEEAMVGCAAKDAIDVDGTLIIVFTTTGRTASVVSKYRPCVPVLVVTDSDGVARQTSPCFAQYPYKVKALPDNSSGLEFELLLEQAVIYAMETGICQAGKNIIVVHGSHSADAETQPMTQIKVSPGKAHLADSSHDVAKTLSLRSMAISLKDVLDPVLLPRKTKIVCTLGPSCWSEEGLANLMDAGMNVARFNFSHGSHSDHQAVLDRLRGVAAAKGVRLAYLLDTKGPEVRTAMVRDGKNIELEAGQEVTLVAVGAEYTTWEGYKDPATGETKIGISYDKLCQSVKPGNRILMSDGSLALEVLQILSPTELKARCLNPKSLGPRKNCNLPGVKVDIPVLTPKDIDDLQTFAAGNKMDFVAASFVQTADDVRFIRKVLDEAGGHNIKIISKIENESGLDNYDAILAESDGIMVARGDLAMEIPSWKVALAQKMMITKANIAGKFIITATQMLESMVSNPLPTRAEMTDVANACFDGTDAVMLSGETANGKFPDTAVSTMASIVANAENSNGYVTMQCFIRDHSPKPFTPLEAFAATVCAAVVDCNAALVIVLSKDGTAAGLVAKYRPAVPQLVVTSRRSVANQAAVVFGQYALQEADFSSGEALVEAAKAHAQKLRLWDGSGRIILLHGKAEPSADAQPVFSVL